MDDAALALLASRVDDSVSVRDLGRALKQANGNVDEAEQLINDNRSAKRRKVNRLDGWLAPRQSEAAPKVIAREKRVKLATSSTKTINDVLKGQSSSLSVVAPTQLPPLLLGTPALVQENTPCTLHFDILPSELAAELFLELLRESQTWQRNKWYMVEREVISPHTTAFFYDDRDNPDFGDAGAFWYNGRETGVKTMPSAVQRARDIVEVFVNQELRKRQRMPLEWAGDWKANVCAANCYDGAKESVGFHSDRLNYLGPCPTIASVSLGVGRNFRLRGASEPDLPKRTYDIPLPHNSLCIMHAGCQEGFKHAITPQKSIDVFRLKNVPEKDKNLAKSSTDNAATFTQRINITYRFYRPDFCPSKDSHYEPLPVCKCGQPCILRPDMKNKQTPTAEGKVRYFWQCQAGSATDGKSCGHFEILSMQGRGPCVKDLAPA